MDDNVILLAFRANAIAAGFDEETVGYYTAAVKDVLTDTVIPAAERLYDQVQTLESYITEPFGLAAREGGKEYYTYLIQGKTGSDMTMEEMYDYLVQGIEGMEAEFEKVYLSDRTLFDRYESAEYGTTDYRAILDTLKDFVAKDFPAIRETQYTVSALPDELCVDGVLAYFMPPQIDNLDRKVIRVNPHYDDNDIELFATLAHEGYPGHLYQFEYFSSSEGYHPINAALSYLGYSEGWTTMIEQEAYKWACNGDENVAFIFNLDHNYLNALVAAIDIGVNYYGWDLAKVRSFFGSSLYGDSAATAQLLLDAVVSDPGTYIYYSLGYFMCNDIIDALMLMQNRLRPTEQSVFGISLIFTRLRITLNNESEVLG